jgi:lipoyl-dependent peroxiredoxin
MRRRASAVWRGKGADGQGTVSTNSGALKDNPYNTGGRFVDEEGKAGTNPEELIAAAHAACFSMATAFGITGAGFEPTELKTDALLTLNKQEAGWRIESIHLTLRGKVPGMTAEQFRDAAEKAKVGCPISNVLKAEITLDANLES